MKLLKDISKLFTSTNKKAQTHPEDVEMEQRRSDNALREIELRDR